MVYSRANSNKAPESPQNKRYVTTGDLHPGSTVYAVTRDIESNTEMRQIIQLLSPRGVFELNVCFNMLIKWATNMLQVQCIKSKHANVTKNGSNRVC